MSKMYYRIVFNGLRKDGAPDTLIAFMKDKLAYSDGKIRLLMLSSPRVLTFCDTESQAIDLMNQLEEKGGRVTLETMEHNSDFPYPLSDFCHRRIRYEIANAGKSGMKIALISVRVVPSSEDKPVASLLSGYDELIDREMKGAVATLPVDESRILLLDVFSDPHNAYPRLDDIDTMLVSLFDETFQIFRGISYFPHNGTSIAELLRSAEQQTSRLSPLTKPATSPQPDLEGRLSLKNLIKDGESASDLLQQSLIGARGRKFKWLTEQPLDGIWVALGKLPKVRQTEFLYRLDVESPLASELEAAINDGKPAGQDPEALRKTEELLIKLSGFDNDDRFAQIRQDIPTKLKNVSSFPTLSKVATTIISIARDPNSDVSELTAVIKNDPALTLVILKVVNSAYYGFPQKIESIERAVVIIGYSEVINLALGLGLAQAIDISPSQGLYPPQALWHHLMGSALICRYLYKKYNKQDEPELFTAGLLHDFGKIFLVLNYPEIYGKLHMDSAEFSIPLYELEEECFGINHAVIGKYIGSNWNLPEPLIQAAAYHHQPFFATGHPRLAAIIGFADFLYHRIFPDHSEGQAISPCPPYMTLGLWNIIRNVFPGIRIEDIDTLAEESGQFIAANEQIFSILK